VTRELLAELSDLCHKDVVFSAIISNLARSAPFLDIPESEIILNKIESWEKEIGATQEMDRDSVLDYSVWFDPEVSLSTPIGDHMPPAPLHNGRIRRSLQDWARRMAGTLLFPQIQMNKTMSRATARAYQSARVGYEGGPADTRISSADVERFYADTGYRVPGVCEIRQAWKFNELTPRTYFSQGGTTFHASKYIRDIANTLSEHFPEVDYKTRFSYHDLEISDEHLAFIYDYTSFTSLLSELKFFLSRLATETMGVPICVVDSYHGIINTTLGSVLQEYNEVCNRLPEYSLERFDLDLGVLSHRISGFLGVYGNISLSTTLHGLHACQLCGDLGGCKCVGDDVYGSAKAEGRDKPEIIARIQALGEVNPLKVRWWPHVDIENEDAAQDRTWPYTKRPFFRFGDRMFLEQSLYLPIFGLIAPIPDGHREDDTDAFYKTKILATQVLSLIRQWSSLHPPPRVGQKLLLEGYVQMLYKRLGIPEDGYLPFESFNIGQEIVKGLFVPSIKGDFLEREVWSKMEERFGADQIRLVRIPKTSREPFYQWRELIKYRGDERETCMERRLSYLQSMDWAMVERVFEERFMDFEEYSSFYSALIAGEFASVYSACISVNAPSWVDEFLLIE